MSPAESFPLFRLKGSPNEIGRQHGELLASRIVRTFDFYRGLVSAVPEAVLKDLAFCYEGEIRNYSSRLAEEIDGIAQGAGLEPWKLYLLNSRTELIRELKPPGECTAAYFRDLCLLGQNWDWAQELEELVVLLEIENQAGHKILMLTEPGIIGKIGLNSSGLGVCLNILRCDKSLRGVPIHILLRSVLEEHTLGGALEAVSRAKLGTMSNMMIANREGNGVNVEIAGPSMAAAGEGERFILHTNHYLAHAIVNERKDFESSYLRYERGRQILEASNGLSLAAMRDLLADRENGDKAICSPYVPDDVIGSVGTVCSIIMDLSERTLALRPGNPPGNSFRLFRLQ